MTALELALDHDRCAECGHEAQEHDGDICDECSMIESLSGALSVAASPLHTYRPEEIAQ